MENRKEIKSLFIRYVKNQVNLNEEEQVRNYLLTAVGKSCMKEVMDELAAREFNSEGEMDSRLSNEIYTRLQQSIKSADRSASKSAGKQFYFSSMLKLAAVFAGLLLLSAVVYKVYQDHQSVVYTTASGQKEKIILPDFSTVTLNGSSSLTYNKGWNSAEKREVHLDGEAYFDVVKSTEKPFIVHTSKLKIKVLGTSFNVKSYKEDDLIETTLVEGKVAIENGRNKSPDVQDVILTPNQKAVFYKASEKIVLTKVETAYHTSWKSGKLIFEDEPFGEIVKDLERWYGVKIKLSKETSRQCRFRVKIEDESIKEVLDLFKSTTDLTYTIEGNEITIKGKLCNETN